MKRKKLIIVVLSVLIILELLVFATFAASGRVYIFTFTWPDANTRAAGNNTVLSHLWDMGYDAGEYLNNDAPAGYSVLPSAKIWVAVTHAEPGCLVMGSSRNVSYIYAYNSVTGDNRSISNLSSTALSNLRLIMYVGCETGLTSVMYGNLVHATSEKGAQCVVGWNESIAVAPSANWVRLLFEKADEEHDVLWECFNHADYWVADIFGQSYANQMQNRHEAGNISQYLHN